MNLVAAATEHPCSWVAANGRLGIAYVEDNALKVVTSNGIEASTPVTIAADGQHPAAVRMAPSDDVAIFWVTENGALMAGILARSGDAYALKAAATTLIIAGEGPTPIAEVCDVVQQLSGMLVVVYSPQHQGVTLLQLYPTLEVKGIVGGVSWYDESGLYGARVVRSPASDDLLLAAMKLNAYWTSSGYHWFWKKEGLFVIRLPWVDLSWSSGPVYWPGYGNGQLITADADDLYGIDRQPSGVYVVHYIYDGTRQTMTSSDGGQTWA